MRPSTDLRADCLKLALYLLSIFVLLGGISCAHAETSTASAPAETSAPSPFPLHLSADGRYLEDANGSPFLIHGDTAWNLLVQLTKESVETYLEDRKQKGFNAIIVELIVASFYGPNAPRNAYGDAPFTSDGDFSTPNEAYFSHVDWVLAKAAEKGIAVFLNPAYFGHPSFRDGFWADITNNGPLEMRNYGRYLGNRYKNHTNIVWTVGGDRTPSASSAGEKNALQMVKGIKETATAHLWTAHWDSKDDSLDVASFLPYLDLNGIYSYQGATGYIHQRSLDEYGRPDFKPIYLYEGWYEGAWEGDLETIRKQAYESNLSGATGQFFGSQYVWEFGGGETPTETDLDSPGVFDMVRLKELFRGRAWHLLVPDENHETVTSGYGTRGESDYVSSARTRDGNLVLAYVPSSGAGRRSIVVAMAQVSGKVRARWYDPTSGTYTTIPGSPFANRGSRTFSTPGPNQGGAGDWVLVLETERLDQLTPSPSNISLAPQSAREGVGHLMP